MNAEPNKKITLESSLKAIEIENFLDRYFYRPVAFRMALVLRHTSVTPNMVTIVSIIVGMTAGSRFYYADLYTNLIGVLLLILANTLDCVDGQLARLTGIKSKIGRILDGFAGDLWFATAYISICLRMMNEGWPAWIFLLAVLSGYSHSRQAAMADYFKNIHLYFIKGESGSELDDSASLQKKYLLLSWKNEFWEKLFQFFYRFYTKGQEDLLPQVNVLRSSVSSRYEAIPQSMTADFKQLSSRAIQWMHALAFNGRTPFLFAVVLLGFPWLYFVFEIVLLNLALLMGIISYRRILSQLNLSLQKGKYDEK